MSTGRCAHQWNGCEFFTLSISCGWWFYAPECIKTTIKLEMGTLLFQFVHFAWADSRRTDSDGRNENKYLIENNVCIWINWPNQMIKFRFYSTLNSRCKSLPTMWATLPHPHTHTWEWTNVNWKFQVDTVGTRPQLLSVKLYFWDNSR